VKSCVDVGLQLYSASL